VAIDPIELKLSNTTYSTVHLKSVFGALRESSGTPRRTLPQTGNFRSLRLHHRGNHNDENSVHDGVH
jgi:hypothetical protein